MATEKQHLMSVCIPTYEMHGVGPQFLKRNFDILAEQTFKDFDVVISDYSVRDVIKVVCDQYKNTLDIRYFRNTDHDQLSKMSANTNNVIRHATGKIVKILFLDDFLYDEKSLETIAKNFDLAKDHWLMTACMSSRDGVNFYRPFYPRYHDKIHLYNNTLSAPSVMAIKNDNPLLFDMRLKWFMDVEYYKRCYDKFGPPKIVDEFCTVIGVGDHQTTNNEIHNALVDREFAMVVRNFYPAPYAALLIGSHRLKSALRKVKYSFIKKK